MGLNEDFNRALYSVPVRVQWQGWQSDTYTLRRMGWQIFVDEGVPAYEYAHSIRLIIKAPDDKLLIMGEKILHPHEIFDRNKLTMMEVLCHGGIEMQAYRASDRIFTYEQPKVAWESMDAALPCDGFVHFSEERDLKDLKLFNYTEKPKEIYIPLNSVDDCLNRILQLQYPEQELIKPKLALVKPAVQVKIYSIAA